MKTTRLKRASLAKSLPCLALAAFALAVAPATAMAGHRHHRYAPLTPDDAAYSWITVNGTYGTSPSTISAPVRPGPTGPEVRLPGGAWVRCGTTCYNTLRSQTVDFWHSFSRD